MKKFLMFLISPFSQKIRCKYGFHDYKDGDVGEPWHFIKHKCKTCNKKFYF